MTTLDGKKGLKKEANQWKLKAILLEKKVPLFLCPALPKWEIVLCWTVALGTIAYGFFNLWKVSSKWHFLLAQYGSVSELPLIGLRSKDESDFAWLRWNQFMRGYLPFLLAHSVVFNLLPKFFPNENTWAPLYTIMSIAACVKNFSIKVVVFSLLQGLFTFGCTITFKRVSVVWLSVLPMFYIFAKHTNLLGDNLFYVLLFLPHTVRSYISFCLELARKLDFTEDAASKPNSSNCCWLLSRMFFYVFYQPYLCTLIVLYPDFERQIAQRNSHPRAWKTIVCKAFRLAFWWIMTELALYFFYFGAISQNAAFLRKLPKDEFICIGIAIAAFFYLKCVVIYGLPTVFAMLDGMQPVKGPICIFRISLFSNLWRGFDRGMHAFFKEYIYLPVCGPNISFKTRMLGLYVSYLFVLTWHGLNHNKIVWILLNMMGLNIEFGAKAFYSLPFIKSTREGHLSDQWFRRLLALLQIIPFLLGIFSNIYYLAGSAVGWQYVHRIIWEEIVALRWHFLLSISTLAYFHIQIVMETNMRWPDRQMPICPLAGTETKKDD